MTCYFRHIKNLFTEMGIEVTNENKRDIDRVIHKLVGVEYKDCSSTWKAFKKKRETDEMGFIKALKEAITD